MTSPYISAVLQTKVMLQPAQMNANVYANVKENLRKAILNKCNESGCVVDIHKVEMLDGECRAENMDADSDVEVAYSCKLCNPQVDQYIVCELIKYNKPFLVANNGPITAIIRSDRIILKNFNIEGEDVIHVATGKKLEAGDLVKVRIFHVIFSTGGETIMATAELENVPSALEIEAYKRDIGQDKTTTSMVDTSKVNAGIMTPGQTFEDLNAKQQ
jgi:DNA-directed RNA polymerase subunit E'/Rpb7